MIRRYALLVAFMAIAAMGSANPDITLASEDPVPLDPAVRMGKLPNGFTYYLRKHDVPRGRAEFRLVVNAGNRHQDADQLGIAHLVEHLAFNGSVHYPGEALRNYFDKWGLVPGNDWNGSTGNETYYKLSLPTDQLDLYDSGFQILRDWAQGLTLSPEEIEAERGVVLEESRDSRVMERDAEVLNHPKYDRHFHIHHDTNIRTAKAEVVTRFYNDWYRPDLQAAIVVGDIDLDAAEEKIKSLFSDLHMPEHPRPAQDYAAQYSVPLTGKNRRVELVGGGAANVTVRLLMKAKTARPVKRTVTDYKQAMLDELCNSMLRARTQRLNERSGMLYEQVSMMIVRKTLNPNALIDALETYLSLDSAPDIEKGLKIAIDELERIRRHGFVHSELALAKEEVGRQESKLGAIMDSERLADRYIGHFAEQTAAPAPAFEATLNTRLLNAITLDDINRMVSEWIRMDRDFDIVLTSNQQTRQKLPSQRQFQRWIAEIQRGTVEPFAEPLAPVAQLMTAAEVARLAAAAVNKSAFLAQIGVTQLELRNGVKLVLKPTPATGQSARINIRGFRTGGLGAYPAADRAVAKAAGMLAQYSGAGRHDRYQINAFMREHEIDVALSIGAQAAILSGGGPVDELENILQLIYLRVTALRKDPATLDEWIAAQRKDVQRRKESPDSISDRTVRAEMFGARLDPHRFDQTELESIDLSRVYEIYNDRFSKTGDYTFVVTGAFAIEETTALLVKYLGALPSQSSMVSRDLQQHESIKLVSVDRVVYAGDTEIATIKIFSGGRFEDNLMNRIQLELLGTAVQMRGVRRLREKESGTYGVIGGVSLFSAVSEGSGKGQYLFYLEFNTAPSDVQRLVDAAKNEFAKLHADGLDIALFDSIIATAKQDRVRLTGNISWSAYLTDCLQRGLDPTEILKRQSLISDILTLEIMNAAARQYFDSKNVMTFVRLPERHKKSHD